MLRRFAPHGRLASLRGRWIMLSPATLRRLGANPQNSILFPRTAAPSRQMCGRKKAQPLFEAGLLSF